MCRAHCHRIIKLSGTLGSFAPEKELVENTHGVRQSFLDYGEALCDVLQSRNGRTDPIFGADAEPKVYFIGMIISIAISMIGSVSRSLIFSVSYFYSR